MPAAALDSSLILRAARGEATERTPIWMMRQAGRTDPKYNALRESCGLPLEDLFRHPELAAEISLLPRRIGVDAIIYFQDILTPLSPLGAHFKFAPGPVIEAPIAGPADLKRLHRFDAAEALPFIPETFRLVRQSLDGALPVLGFAGAPLTLALFLLEGKSPGRGAAALAWLDERPADVHALLDLLTDTVIDVMRLQLEAGAAMVQLFESCACMLTPAQYREFALPYQQRIFEALRGKAPTIVFARSWPHIEDLAAAGADLVSLPESISIGQARAALGPDAPVQGNLDNQLLARGPWEAIEAAAAACLAEGGRRGHIFNLSHGLLRETPFEHVTRLVETVRGARVCTEPFEAP